MRIAINIRYLYGCKRKRCLACVFKKKAQGYHFLQFLTAEAKQQWLMLNTPNRPENRGSLSEVNL